MKDQSGHEPPIKGQVKVYTKGDKTVLELDEFYYAEIPNEHLCIETMDMAIDLIEKKVLAAFRHSAILAFYSHLNSGAN